MMGNGTDEIINDVFSSFLCSYEIGLEVSMKVSDFI